MSRVLRVLVDDAPTVVTRLALLLSRSGVELTALSVHPMEGVGLRLLVVELDAGPATLERIGRRLVKMINVVDVRAT